MEKTNICWGVKSPRFLCGASGGVRDLLSLAAVAVGCAWRVGDGRHRLLLLAALEGREALAY